MKKIPLGFAILGMGAAAFAADPSKSPKLGQKSSASAFSLLPKALQKNPTIDCNILTEMTPAGQELRPPAPQEPTYYFPQVGNLQNLGEVASANAKPIPPDRLRRAVKESLAAAGYLEAAAPEHQPVVVIVINYGSHAATNGEAEHTLEANAAQADYEEAVRERATLLATLEAANPNGISSDNFDKMPPPPEPPSSLGGETKTVEELLPFILADPRRHKQLIDRAALMGGVAFAEELAKVLKEETTVRQTSAASDRGADRLAAQADRQKIISAASGYKNNQAAQLNPTFDLTFVGPFYRYYRRDEKTTYLVNEAFGSCYFVVASAFDGAAMAKGEKRLLWRTKLTVNSNGVAMGDVVPVLVAAASPYFGRETDGTVRVSKRVR